MNLLQDMLSWLYWHIFIMGVHLLGRISYKCCLFACWNFQTWVRTPEWLCTADNFKELALDVAY